MSLHRSFIALLSVLSLAACEKNAVQDLTGPLPVAGIRFFNFAVNAPAVHFYSGDRKLTATVTASCQAAKNPPVTATDSTCVTTGIQSTGGVGYGGVSAGRLYTGITPGQHTIHGRITATTDNGLAITSVPVTIQAGKNYSFFQSGFYNTTTKQADGFVVEDDYPAAINWNAATVRFVNAISNSQPMAMSGVDTESGNVVEIGGLVAYKAAGAFVSVPPGAYDLRTRVAGSSTNAILRTNVPFEAGVVYTITARGDMTVTSTTATNRPFLDNTINR